MSAIEIVVHSVTVANKSNLSIRITLERTGPLKENGPFHPTKDGQHLQENVFAWNKVRSFIHLNIEPSRLHIGT